jgi:hypothetical protein
MGDVKKSFCANFIRKSIFAKEAAEISQVANTSCRKQKIFSPKQQVVARTIILFKSFENYLN